MADQEIRIRISADGAAQAGAQFERTAGQLGKLGPAARSSTQAMGQVSAQLTDIGTSLAGGQNPLLVLIQQGGQLKDMFGGIAPAARAVGGTLAAMVTPASVFAAAIGGVALAAAQGYRESAQLRDAILLTGGAAGVTAGRVGELARETASAAKVSIGSAREITAQFLSTGRIGGEALGVLSEAAARLSKVSGQTEQEVVRDLAGMSDGIARWAAEHNRAWHFVTAEQLEYIQKLEDSGDAQGAMVATGEALIQHLGKHESQLGLVEKAWYGLGRAASSAWDAILDVGRQDSAEEKLRRINEQLERGANYAGAMAGGSSAPRGALLREKSELQRQLRREGQAADLTSALALQEAERIKLSGQLAAVTGRLTGSTSQYQESLRVLVQAEKAGNITLERRLELTRLLAEKEGASVKADAERKAAEKKAKQEKAEQDYQQLVRDTLRNRAPRLADIEAAGYAESNAAADKNMADAVARQRRYNDQAEDLAQQLADETAQINVSMIADDRERGLAQIELERQTMQARLDAMKAGGADITAAQEALNANILAKQKTLKSQLSQEWASLSRAGEDMFATLMSGGKVDLASVAKGLSADWARRTWRQDVEPLFADNAKVLKDLLTGTTRQADAADGATRSTSIFAQGLELMSSAFGSTAQVIVQWVSSLSSSSGSGGGALGGIASFFGSLFGGSGSSGSGMTSGNMGLADYGLGGGRATGGPVRSGFDYVVGENGPERLRMFKGGGGFVTPGGMGGRAQPQFVQHVHNHFAAGVSPAQFAAGLEAQKRQMRAEMLTSAARPGRELWRINRGG